MRLVELPSELVLLIMGFIPLDRSTVNICRAFRSVLKNKDHAAKMVEAWKAVSAYLPPHHNLGTPSVITWPDSRDVLQHAWVGDDWNVNHGSFPRPRNGSRLVPAATQLLRIGIYGKLKKRWFLSAAEWDFVEFVCHGIVTKEVNGEDNVVRQRCMPDAVYFTLQLLAHRAGYEIRWFNREDWDELRHKVFMMQMDAKIVVDNFRSGAGCMATALRPYGVEFTERYKTVGDTPDMLRVFLKDGSAVNGDVLWPIWRTTGWIRMPKEETDEEVARAPIKRRRFAELFGESDEEDHTDPPGVQDSAAAPTPWQPDELTAEALFGSSDVED